MNAWMKLYVYPIPVVLSFSSVPLTFLHIKINTLCFFTGDWRGIRVDRKVGVFIILVFILFFHSLLFLYLHSLYLLLFPILWLFDLVYFIFETTQDLSYLVILWVLFQLCSFEEVYKVICLFLFFFLFFLFSHCPQWLLFFVLLPEHFLWVFFILFFLRICFIQSPQVRRIQLSRFTHWGSLIEDA